MRVRVEFNENTRRACDMEWADTIEELAENWDMGYDSGVVDDIERDAIEVDGGIDWNSVEFYVWHDEPNAGWEKWEGPT